MVLTHFNEVYNFCEETGNTATYERDSCRSKGENSGLPCSRTPEQDKQEAGHEKTRKEAWNNESELLTWKGLVAKEWQLISRPLSGGNDVVRP